ncbi:P27 family phage terminase small subunit [Gordonia sp. HS-NH1]|uniref:P27 family phage terminase small subunit n=1 Tax=Gordonia sp. HS-NH1 TaxID=1435068 RepID=UPI0006E224E7|nr:P27 family phage terminase small subunit [Gordonia sp. HS-NH1]
MIAQNAASPRKTASKAKPAGVDMSAGALRQFYVDEAVRLGLVLDHADEILIENACATIATITALQRSIDSNGAVIVSPTGGVKNNPATTEIRQQRLALAKLQQLVEHRFTTAANAGKLTSRGTPPGALRGPYAGDGGERGQADRRNAAVRRPSRTRKAR